MRGIFVHSLKKQKKIKKEKQKYQNHRRRHCLRPGQEKLPIRRAEHPRLRFRRRHFRGFITHHRRRHIIPSESHRRRHSPRRRRLRQPPGQPLRLRIPAKERKEPSPPPRKRKSKSIRYSKGSISTPP
ncbi:hypothetical protein ABFS82_05G040200 [Erythranthe guttata]